MAVHPSPDGSTEWTAARLRLRPARLLVSALVAVGALLVAAAILPGVRIPGFADAVVAAFLIAALNAVLPPLVAALRAPFTVALGFVAILAVDAFAMVAVSRIDPHALQVDSFWWALLAALVMAAASVVLETILGADDDDTYNLRVIRRVARRQGASERTDSPGIVFLEIDGLAHPVLRRAMRDGSAPELARWLEEGTHRLVEWEPDLSSQTGASQAGILLGSNDDIPAFRWVDKETRRLVTCSAPADCEEIERGRTTGRGLLTGGGASRGNLFSGEADEVILTVSRLGAEKRANPGYRAFFANGFNVTRALVLFTWEVAIEVIAGLRQVRRDVRPRGHRGGKYPLLRAAMCVIVRDLVVFGVLTDMMRGRPAIYATFASYDEVAHHSGLERSDTLEALRKLDQQLGRVARARRYAPRPYELVVLSDHGQTQGATFLQRNGYGLEALVERSLDGASVARLGGGDENDVAVGHAVTDATGRGRPPRRARNDLAGRRAVVLGSGNLGLVYLMEETRRLTLEEIEQRHPRLVPALREHPDVGFLLVRSAAHGPVVLGAEGANFLAEHRVVGGDPLAPFSANAAAHLRRTDGFAHAPDILVNSFYDAALDQACAFEELISFHGGLGGSQTRPFLLYPASLPAPAEPILGAVRVHDVLLGWRRWLQDGPHLVRERPAQAGGSTVA
ncbi:MAG TPA: phage holin family protein [Candidatus Dormibacteraeota bacterium]|nr:phage holin family protein [Candidatus Dormibacteraeota bacterium]